MSFASLPAVVMASVTFYVGFQQLFLYFRQRRRRENLTFALMCFALVSYDVFCAGLYNAASPGEGLYWQRAQFVAVALAATALLWFMADYTLYPSRKGVWAFSACFVLVALAQLAGCGSLTWHSDQPFIKLVQLPLGLRIVYQEMRPGPLTDLECLMGLAALAYMLWMGKRLHRTGQRAKARPLLWALALFAAGAINDAAVSIGLYPFVYTLEYAYLGLVLLMAHSIAGAVVEAAAMKDALEESEQKHRTQREFLQHVLDSCPNHIFVKDKKGRITLANRALAEVYGTTPEGLVGKTVLDYVPDPKFAEEMYRDDMAILKEGQDRLEREQRYVDRSGNVRWAHVIKLPMKDQHGNVEQLIGVSTDVSLRKEAVEALRKSEAWFRAIFNNQNTGIGVVGKSDRRYVEVNDKWAQMLGYSPEELKTIGPHDVIHPDDHPLSQGYVHQVEAGTIEFCRFERRFVRKDGSVFWGDQSITAIRASDGQLEGTIGATIDVTERKQSEAALRQSEQRLELALEASNLGLWDWDLQTDEIVAHARSARMLGYALEETEPQYHWWRELIHPDDLAAMTEAFNAHLERRETTYIAECRMRRKSGEWRWIEWLGRVVERDEQGQPLRAVGTHRNVTRRHAREEERQKRQEQIQHSQKLESLGVLAGGIAHDFNNLLMGILGSASLALMEMSPTSPGRDSIAHIETAAHRAADLTRQLLAYSGKGRFVVQPIDLSVVVEEMGRLLEISISKKAVLRFDLAPRLPAVEADATQIRQVVMNLITNASEAIGDRSGIISVTTSAMTCDSKYLRETFLNEDLAEGPYVYLEVSDNGCGMDKATVDRIFDPFFTTKFTGRGLGLAAVMGIVRGHRGAVKVYSELGRGTTFKVLFPSCGKRADAEDKPSEAMPRVSAGGTILVVDDEETVRTLAVRMLERAGFSVLAAPDGRQAVEVFRQNAEKIALVLLDMTMPHMGGEEAFREIRRIREDVRVILSSGYNEQDATSSFAGKGLAGFIQKPYRVQDLIAKVREILESA